MKPSPFQSTRLMGALLLMAGALAAYASPAERTGSGTHPAVLPGQIVVNEVEYDSIQSGSDSAYEWFELYNKTNQTQTLDGWSIADNSATDPLPTLTLPPFSFIVVAATDSFYTNYPNYTGPIVFIADGVIGTGLSNSGDRLTLSDPTGVVIDAINWESDATYYSCTGFPCSSGASPGQSLERDPAGQDTDTGADFVVRTIPTPGGGNTNTPTPTPRGPTSTPTQTPTVVPTATPVPGVIPIAQARAYGVGATVTVQGNVSVVPGTYDRGYAIQDSTGGIYVFPSTQPTYTLGTIVQVSGTLTSFNGLLEFSPVTNETNLGQGAIPQPIPYRTGEIGEGTEGWLAKVCGGVSNLATNTFDLNDGSGPVQIFVDHDTGIDLSRVANGDVWCVIGFSGDFNGPEVKPRMQSDLSALALHNTAVPVIGHPTVGPMATSTPTRTRTPTPTRTRTPTRTPTP